MSFVKNKTLIVTGASTGVGRALALELAAKGTKLVLNARGLGTDSKLDAVCSQCAELGVQVACVTGSAGDDATASEMVEKAMELGDFVGFIHVAGVHSPGPCIWELQPEQFDEVFEASVRGAYMLIRHAVPRLLERPPEEGRPSGLAVFFGSGAAQIAQPGIAAYCAAKAAEEHLMRQLAAEAPEICTFAYRPGIVDTRMQTQARHAEGGAAEKLKQVFVPWKTQGELIAPETSARALLRVLEGDLWFHHSTVLRVDDLT